VNGTRGSAWRGGYSRAPVWNVLWWAFVWATASALLSLAAVWWLVPATLAAMYAAGFGGAGGVILGRNLCRWDAGQPAGLVPPRAALARAEHDQQLRLLQAGSRQRSVLVRRLAELLPQLPAPLAWQAVNALDEVGVQAFVPDGEKFDPALHHAVGTEPAPAPDRVNTVARTIRPGYRDSRQVIVFPKVVVYAGADEQRSS
jgi:hypothetical protein